MSPGDDPAAPRRATHPSARVGMIGAGQLARMTQRAAIDLDVHLEVLAARGDDPAVLAGAPYRIGSPDDVEALMALARGVEIVTLDHELVPNEHLVALESAGHTVRPGPDALRFAQDKLHQRTELARSGFPVPPFAEVATLDDVAAFGAQHGWPVVLKARRGGYDGRGVWVLDDLGALGGAVPDGEWFAEAHVPLAMELAVVTARRPGGQQAVYPVVETVQDAGICRELVMPGRVEPAVADAAYDLAGELVEAVGAVGIVAIELFVSQAGDLVVNEFAMRPHNSGHATIEGSATSQFENHLRAVLDWPLGATTMRAPAAVMVNLLGGVSEEPFGLRLERALEVPGAHPHLYGKQPRPGRKIGHVTVLTDDVDDGLRAARRAAAHLEGS